MTPASPYLPRRYASKVLALALLAALPACANSPAQPNEPGQLSFNTQTLDLGTLRASTITVLNQGGMAVGPVGLNSSPISGTKDLDSSSRLPKFRLLTQASPPRSKSGPS